MTKEEKILAVSEFLTAFDAELSMKISMNPNHPTVQKWVKMREALGLFGWCSAEDVSDDLKRLIAE